MLFARTSAIKRAKLDPDSNGDNCGVIRSSKSNIVCEANGFEKGDSGDSSQLVDISSYVAYHRTPTTAGVQSSYCSSRNGTSYGNTAATTAEATTSLGAVYAAGWSYPSTLSYSSIQSQKLNTNGVANDFSTSNMFSTVDTIDASSYSEVQNAAAKGLLQTGTATFATPQYYNSAVYNGQSLSSYGVQNATGALYSSQTSQPYAALSQTYAGRSLKSSPYPLTAYLGAATGGVPSASPYYGSAYSTQAALTSGLTGSQNFAGQPFEYSSYASGNYHTPAYGQYYPGYGPYCHQLGVQTAPVTTTTTYQLSQLPPCTTIASETSAFSAQISLGELSPFAKTEAKKPKGKKRKQSNPSPSPDNDYERVFIWDLDETCVHFQSLMNGSYATKFGKDVNTSVSLGLRMDELILTLSDAQFFYNELEHLQDCDQVHIDDVATDDAGQDIAGYNFSGDGFQLTGAAPLCLAPAVRGGVDWVRKLAFRYRRIREVYELYKNNVGGLLGCGKHEQWLQIRSEIETLTDSWHTLAIKCLALIASRYTQGQRCANVLVTSKQLVPSLSQILLYGMAPVFPIENVYSAAKIGKEACFERVINRFGKKCTYVVIGDGREEEVAAKQLQLPFWRVTVHSDLAALHHALELGHL